MTKSVFTNEYSEFIKILVVARKNAGLSQVEIANRINKNQSYVSKYEHGERRLDIIEFIDIANAIGKNPVEIFSEFFSIISK